MLILQQHRNIALSIKIQAAQSHTKPIDPFKIHCRHFIALQKGDPAPPTRTPMQASLTRKPWQDTHPTGRNIHNKEESQTSSLQKRPPQTHQYKQMKRQRNIQQVKEHDKCPPNQTKEEIWSLPEKEFRIMIVKVIQYFENKMKLQINSLETRIWEDARKV